MPPPDIFRRPGVRFVCLPDPSEAPDPPQPAQPAAGPSAPMPNEPVPVPVPGPVQAKTRFDLAVEFLLEKYHSSSRPVDPDSEIVTRVQQFVASCSNIAAIKYDDDTDSRSVYTCSTVFSSSSPGRVSTPLADRNLRLRMPFYSDSSPSAPPRIESLGLVSPEKRKVDEVDRDDEGLVSKATPTKRVKMRKQVRFSLPGESCEMYPNGEESKKHSHVGPDLPGMSGCLTDPQKTEDRGEVAQRLKQYLGVDLSNPTAPSTPPGNSAEEITLPSASDIPVPRFVLPWPTEPIIPEGAPTWHAGLSALFRHVSENIWQGDWHVPAPGFDTSSSAFSHLAQNSTAYLEFQEVLGCLSLSYALSRARSAERDFRSTLRVMVLGKKKSRRIRRIRDRDTTLTRQQLEELENTVPVVTGTGTSTLRQPRAIVKRIRWCLEQVESRLDVVLDEEFQNLATTTAYEIPTPEALINKAWWASAEGFNLRKQSEQLEKQVDLLKYYARRIQKFLGDIRPAVKFIREIKDVRRTIAAQQQQHLPGRWKTWSQIHAREKEEYRVHPDVVVDVMKGLVRIEAAVNNFITVCHNHVAWIVELRDVPDVLEIPGPSYTPEESPETTGPVVIEVGIQDELIRFEVLEEEAEGEDPIIGEEQVGGGQDDQEPGIYEYIDPEDRHAYAAVERECRAWMRHRCGEIRGLCDLFDGYYLAGKDAYRNLASTLTGESNAMGF